MNHTQAHWFATTNWSLVLDSMDSVPSRAGEAMERLCARYWYPVYAAIRRHGHPIHQAEDLTQEFFAFAIERGLLQKARRERGRFRSFILTSLRNFLHNHHDRASAVKRGGRHRLVPLDEAFAESILASEPPHDASADAFDRRWAVTLIRRVTERLREDYAGRGRAHVYDHLLPCLTGDPEPGDYQRIAAALEMEPATLRMAVHRIRHRFGELLRREVAHTVASPEDVEEEIRYLLSVLADG